MSKLPQTVKAAIFDMDGTLLDSMAVWDDIARQYLLSLGVDAGQEVNDATAPMSLPESAAYIKQQYQLKMTEEEIASGINAMIEDFYFYQAPLKKGVKMVLQMLQDKDIPMCVATATDRHLVEAALQRCSVRHYFKRIFTCTEVGYGKTQPEIYRRSAEFLGAKSSETLVFEDVLFALKTAADDGFLTVAVFDTHEPRQEALKKKADVYLRDFSEFQI